MSQFARPTSDISNDPDWGTSTGGSFWSVLDETPASDIDYADGSIFFTTEQFTVGIGPISDPMVSTLHKITTRLQDFGGVSGVWQITLSQGVTPIASYVAGDGSSSFTDWTYTLTGPEADAIVYTGGVAANLRLTVQVSDAVGGSYQCSQLFFQTPDAPAGGATNLMPQICL